MMPPPFFALMNRILCLSFLLSALPAVALDLLPRDWPVQASLSGRIDLESYLSDGPPPALIFSDDGLFFNPRVSLFADVHLGSHWYGFAQARFDRGFDPGLNEGGRGRLDEYLLRWTPLDSPVVNLQVGKFAAVFGNWVQRHLAWDNPFVTAPLAYESVLIITDQGAPAAPAGFLGRRNQTDTKASWVPVIWGPSYATGASLFGRIERFDYALEVKNASLSSRPAAWGVEEVGFSAPTFSGRLGFRPDAAWNFGLSGSSGAYITADPAGALPAGTRRGDFQQQTLGLDASYAHGHLQLWSEVILSRFQVPNVGNADSLSYFVEAKYKFTESLFAALRWNQQLFDAVPDGRGGSATWESRVMRIDTAIGYRFNRSLQLKLQYSYGHENSPAPNGEHLLATQLTWRF